MFTSRLSSRLGASAVRQCTKQRSFGGGAQGHSAERKVSLKGPAPGSFSVFSFLFADSSRHLNVYFHQTGIALAVLTPLAFLGESGGMLSTVSNLAMTPIIGFHALVSMNNVVTDYVPKDFRTGARFLVLGSSLLIVLGGLNLILMQGKSLTGLVGDLWRKPKKTEE